MDRAVFDRDIRQLVRRHADFVSAIPATPDNYFAYPGGLFRMSLEIAFFALQGTSGHIFSGSETITRRRDLEPRWRRAAFYAGLCAGLHGTLHRIEVTDPAGARWPTYLCPLSSWARDRKARCVFIGWNHDVPESRALGVYALPHIVPHEILLDLGQGNTVIVPQMLACISGMAGPREHNVLNELVRRARALVIHRDLTSAAERSGIRRPGSHLAEYLIDAMRRLIETKPSWAPNTHQSRVWCGGDGLYIAWPNAAADIVDLLEEHDRLLGMPASAEDILGILARDGIVVPFSEHRPLWTIRLPGTTGKAFKSPSQMAAIRLISPEVLLDADRRPAFSGVLASIDPAPAASGPLPSEHAAAADLGLPRQISLDIGPATSGRREPTMSEPTEASIDAAMLEPRLGPPPPHAGFHAAKIALKPPATLSGPLLHALIGIVDSLNTDPHCSAAFPVAEGLFVPLRALEERRLDPPDAIRRLADANMLLVADEGRRKTHERPMGGTMSRGIVLLREFLPGLPPDSTLPAAEELPC